MRYFVMAGLVPATHEHRAWIKRRGGGPATADRTLAIMGGRDKPGHDVRKYDWLFNLEPFPLTMDHREWTRRALDIERRPCSSRSA
jgi:hypothetical protein